MKPCANTGPTVPAWIREEVARYEGAWPLAVLAAGLGMLIVFEVVWGAVLWNAEPVVVYAFP